MSKLIMLVAVLALAWWLIRRALRELRKDVPPPVAAEDMVRCSRCGVHLPRSESVSSADKPYCSEEHARLSG